MGMAGRRSRIRSWIHRAVVGWGFTGAVHCVLSNPVTAAHTPSPAAADADEAAPRRAPLTHSDLAELAADRTLFGAEATAPCPGCGEDTGLSVSYCARCGACTEPEASGPRAAFDVFAATEATEPPSPVGALFDGRYRVFQEVGRGGMGIVFRARDERLNRMVALKMLPEAFDTDPEIVLRFQREAQLLAKLDHPNVVPVYGDGRVGRLHYFAMKWLPGETVAAALVRHQAAGTQMAPAEAARVAAAVCHGLQHVHGRTLVHRDVKPANIMLGPCEQVTLMDFGIVKARFTAALTLTGRVFGTPEYMAPEQAQGLAPASPLTDIYSVGVLLYEMLTGRLPYRGETPYAVVVSHINDTPPALADVVPGIDPDLVAVVMRALDKRPRKRFANAREMARALERLANADRRRTRRVLINQAFDTLDGFALEYAADISLEGCFIRTENPVEPGTCVQLRFTILDDDLALIEGEGRVTRVIDRPGHQGMGVAFQSLTEASWLHLRRFLASRTPA